MSKDNITIESLHTAFLVVDANGDGFLSWEELENFLSSASVKCSTSSKEKFNELISNPERGDLVGKIVCEVIFSDIELFIESHFFCL